jgi:phosphomannomutase/phosphoglucomutase
MIPESIFRAYDIRGVYGKDITEKIVQRIGRALAAYMDGKGKTVLLGRDVRLSSKPLGDAFSKGMLDGGLNVEDIGTVTTPLLYWASVHYKKDGGVMVTASHNPAEWNGLKIWAGKGFISMGKGMEALRDLAVKGNFSRSSRGSVSRNPNAIEDYESYVSKKVEIRKGLSIIADPGNGSCSLLTPSLFQKTGINVDAINTEPDGTFPAHSPEPNEETLSKVKQLVLRKEADFGVGFDGDGDRAVFVDDKGRLVSSTDIFLMLTEHYLKRRRGAAVVYEVSCSLAVEETIKAYGGKPVVSRVGHTYISDKMLRENAVFGGETSGHFYFTDVYGFDDAMFTCLKITEVLSKKDQKFSEIVDCLPKYPRIPGKSYSCDDEKKFQIVEELAKEFAEMGYKTVTIDGVKVIEDEGWFLIRPSNTQPLVRLTVEAKTNEALQRLARLAEKKIIGKV